MQQLSTGKSPGVDGLPAEFYKVVWGVLGEDLYDVFCECFKRGCLPISCQIAVLSLLPRSGDLGLLKNWRPVSLMCLGYKILSKSLANRIKSFLHIVVEREQTYCIPGCTIMDNLFLMRDVIEMSFRNNLDVGFLSIDQEKAFDRVGHEYLFNVLKAFGFGESIISWIKLLYEGASVMLKMGGGLSCPVPVERGIRQGCPLSGQLYSLAIEPLLCKLRNEIKGLMIPGDNSGLR